eukprot:15793101-Heterocapsa_arctica.AAC.1
MVTAGASVCEMGEDGFPRRVPSQCSRSSTLAPKAWKWRTLLDTIGSSTSTNPFLDVNRVLPGAGQGYP